MSIWPLRRISDVSEYVTVGYVGPQSKLFVDSGIPLIRGQNVLPYSLNLNKLKYIPPEVHAKWRKSALQPGDVVVVRVGYPGTACVIPDGLGELNAASLVIIRPNVTASDPHYLTYVLNSDFGKATIASLLVGSAQQVLNTGTVAAMEVPLPPLPTQRKIAAILSTYNDLIANNNRRINLLEDMTHRIYREWFVDFRYPGHEDVPLVDSQLGPIPEGWEVTPLSAVCERITDGAHLSPATRPVGKPMASVKDMTPRGFDLDTCRRIGIKDYEVLVRQDCRPRVNDVLIAKDGSYLKYVFVVRQAEEVVILSSIALLRPNDAIKPDVLSLCLQQPETKARLKGFVSGVAIPRIVLKDFRVFSIVRPPDALQKDLVAKITPLLLMALELDKTNMTLCAARDLLLPRLISGDIDVRNLNIVVPEAAA